MRPRKRYTKAGLEGRHDAGDFNAQFLQPITQEVDMEPEQIAGAVIPRPANITHAAGSSSSWPTSGATSQPTAGYLLHGIWADLKKPFLQQATIADAEASRDAADAARDAAAQTTIAGLRAAVEQLAAAINSASGSVETPRASPLTRSLATPPWSPTASSTSRAEAGTS